MNILIIATIFFINNFNEVLNKSTMRENVIQSFSLRSTKSINIHNNNNVSRILNNTKNNLKQELTQHHLFVSDQTYNSMTNRATPTNNNNSARNNSNINLGQDTLFSFNNKNNNSNDTVALNNIIKNVNTKLRFDKSFILNNIKHNSGSSNKVNSLNGRFVNGDEKSFRRYLAFLCNNTIITNNYHLVYNDTSITIYNNSNNKLPNNNSSHNFLYTYNIGSEMKTKFDEGLAELMINIKKYKSHKSKIQYYCKPTGSPLSNTYYVREGSGRRNHKEMFQKEINKRNEELKKQRGPRENINKMGAILEERKFNTFGPYWEGGERVYYVTGSPLPITYFITPGHFEHYNRYIPLRHTTPNPLATKFSIMSAYRGCDRACSAYAGGWFGIVCCARFNTQTWVHYYKEFRSICDMENFNCDMENKTWYPIHRGYCTEKKPFFYPNDEYGSSIAHKTEELMSKYKTGVPELHRKRTPEPDFDIVLVTKPHDEWMN